MESFDDVWIPSYKEIWGTPSSGNTAHETNGVSYCDKMFSNSADRIRAIPNSQNSGLSWWLRSSSRNVNPTTSFNYIKYNGGQDTKNATNNYYIVLGFSL